MPEQSQHQQAPLAFSIALPCVFPPGIPPARCPGAYVEEGRGQEAEDIRRVEDRLESWGHGLKPALSHCTHPVGLSSLCSGKPPGVQYHVP